MLEVKGLTKMYGTMKAADHISFSLPNQTVGILLGPNGAGKSTVIKSIAGLLKYEGEIWIQGRESRSLEAKKVFGYVPEIPALFSSLTVREHLEYIRRAYRLNIEEKEIDQLLERLDLLDKADKMGDELSKGMMQKVSICCALLIHPKVILLDEPMVGLDPKAIRELKEIILELKEQGATVLISTHMLEMVEELWDVVCVMEKGKILGTYKRDEVGEQNLDQLFFSVTEQEERKEEDG